VREVAEEDLPVVERLMLVTRHLQAVEKEGGTLRSVDDFPALSDLPPLPSDETAEYWMLFGQTLIMALHANQILSDEEIVALKKLRDAFTKRMMIEVEKKG